MPRLVQEQSAPAVGYVLAPPGLGHSAGSRPATFVGRGTAEACVCGARERAGCWRVGRPADILALRMDWVYYGILFSLLLAGLFLNVLGLPGLWVMVAAAFGYAWATGFGVYLGWQGLLALTLLAALAEVLEFLAGSAGAKKVGGSKRGMVGAIIGGILGAIFFSIPVPIVGTIVGAVVGTFVGAWVVELMVGKEMGQSVEIGFGAAKGRLWGTLLKLSIGFVMLIVAVVVALPVGAKRNAPPLLTGTTPGTGPATVPSTAPVTAPSAAPDTMPAVER